jgi:hypothetical protein
MLALQAPNYTLAQLEQMGGIPTVGPDGHAAMSYTVTMTTLGPSTAGLTTSDLALASAATGAQFFQTTDGLEMVTQYKPGIPISSQQFNSALSEIETENTNRSLTPSAFTGMALSQAENNDAQAFVSALASLRQSMGADGSITPSMLLALGKQANASDNPIPQEYIANAIGFLNGLEIS